MPLNAYAPYPQHRVASVLARARQLMRCGRGARRSHGDRP